MKPPGRTPKPAKPTKKPKLHWPQGLERTPERLDYFRKLSTLPPNLTARQAARRMRRSVTWLRRWAEAFGYEIRSEVPRIKVAYAGVDWTLSNAEIARRLGKTPWAVALARAALGLGRSPFPRGCPKFIPPRGPLYAKSIHTIPSKKRRV